MGGRHSVVIAFDGDEAGEEAMNNSLLTILDVEDYEKDYLRAYVIDGKPFYEALKYLGNKSLSNEYRFWSRPPKGMPEWMRDLFQEQAQTCMRLINERSTEVNAPQDVSGIKRFNAEHTITAVLEQYGFHGVPGRSVKCPKHDDSSPSLSISRDDGRAYCFNQSCVLWHDGYGVDAFELNRILGA